MNRALWIAIVAAGCTRATTEPPDLEEPPDLAVAPDLYVNPLIAERPYSSRAPADYDDSREWPLVILLHGLGSSGAGHEAYFKIGAYADQGGYLFANPDGNEGKQGRFWNGTNYCCDIFNSGVDDVAYLGAVIDDMSARYRVDPKRIYFVGHSNGGFMSHRMACDLSHRVAAFVSLAGANYYDMTRCQPSEPVAALQVHGDKDERIPYPGIASVLPSARASVAFWAKHDGCADPPRKGAPLDLDRALPGAETVVEKWGGCKGGGAELWTIQGAPHSPSLGPRWAEQVWGFLSAHPKP